MTDRPHITVATVVERDGEFLFVRELSDNLVVINQPAGHLETGESLIQAAVRETLEETCWKVHIVGLLGIYTYWSATNNIYYVRHCFIAKPVEEDSTAQLDKEIVAACWLSKAELLAQDEPLRSPLVLRCIEDFENGVRFPLSLLVDP